MPTPRPGRAVINWLWLALANQRLGKAEEARHWLGKAQAWLDQFGDGMPARAEEEVGLHLHNWLEAHVLRREAEAQIPSEDAECDPAGVSARGPHPIGKTLRRFRGVVHSSDFPGASSNATNTAQGQARSSRSAPR